MMRKIWLALAGLCISAAAVFGQFGPPVDDDVITCAEMALMKMNGLIPMRFTNALTGKSIPGAAVNIGNVGSFVTDSDGIIAFSLVPDGSYRLTFQKDGYIETPIAFDVKLGLVILDWFSISPGPTAAELRARREREEQARREAEAARERARREQEERARREAEAAQELALIRERTAGGFRIVLNWGEFPSDLDLHLESGGYHISYRNMRVSADGGVKLDRDDVDSYGPETVTIGRYDPQAEYIVYVMDYTNRNRGSSAEMGRSGALVQVYSSDRLLQTFRVPGGTGVRWNIFRIVRGEIIPVNALSS
jgi:hypothetical protein